MLEWWKDLFRPVRVQDEEFGEMRFLRQTSTWECRTRFSPVRGEVEVLIFSGLDGPTTRQRELWRILPRHYEGLQREARQAIERIGRDLGLADFSPQLAAITLSDDSETEYEVELTYGPIAGPPQFDVRITSWQVREIIGPV